MRRAHEREDFSQRLVQTLKQRGLVPESPTRLARDFNDRFPATRITPQAARKWLIGEAIPSQDKIIALAAWLGVGSEWLRFGQGAVAAARPPAIPYGPTLSDEELMRRYRKLSDRHKQTVAEIVTALAARDSRR